jgi:hypothetical protein
VRLTDDGWDDQVARLITALEAVVQPAGAGARAASPEPEPRWYVPSATPTYRPPPAPPPKRRWRFPVGPAVAIVLVVAVIVVLGVVAVKVFSGFDFTNFETGEPTVTLSTGSGPPGTAVTVSGTGFGSSETIEVRVHATEVGTTQAAADGSFSVEIRVPPTPFRNQQFDITASGKRTIRHDSAPFMVT